MGGSGDAPIDRAATGGSIGTLREKHLHASVRRWYARPGDALEVPVDGYVVDLVRDGLLVEIQTRGFAGVRPKLEALVALGHRVRLVHPIAVDRWIVRVGDGGEALARRRSPRHGTLADVAAELVSFPELLADPGFELEVLLTREEVYRRHDPARCWRRKGWTVVERRLVEVVETVELTGPTDLLGLLPAGLDEPFTTADLAAALGRPRRTAQQLAYCLRKLGLVKAVGSSRGAIEYRRTPAPG